MCYATCQQMAFLFEYRLDVQTTIWYIRVTTRCEVDRFLPTIASSKAGSAIDLSRGQKEESSSRLRRGTRQRSQNLYSSRTVWKPESTSFVSQLQCVFGVYIVLLILFVNNI